MLKIIQVAVFPKWMVQNHVNHKLGGGILDIDTNTKKEAWILLRSLSALVRNSEKRIFKTF